jgi:hypothetical protein
VELREYSANVRTRIHLPIAVASIVCSSPAEIASYCSKQIEVLNLAHLLCTASVLAALNVVFSKPCIWTPLNALNVLWP